MISLPFRYKPLKELAGGGMSETWLCSDENLKRNVVAKTLKPGISKSKLLDELSALSAIRLETRCANSRRSSGSTRRNLRVHRGVHRGIVANVRPGN